MFNTLKKLIQWVASSCRRQKPNSVVSTTELENPFPVRPTTLSAIAGRPTSELRSRKSNGTDTLVSTLERLQHTFEGLELKNDLKLSGELQQNKNDLQKENELRTNIFALIKKICSCPFDDNNLDDYNSKSGGAKVDSLEQTLVRDVNERNYESETFAYFSLIEIVSIKIKRNPECVNFYSPETGLTLLHYAVLYNKLCLAITLCELGASPDAGSLKPFTIFSTDFYEGTTPGMIAARFSLWKILYFFIKQGKGFNLDLKDKRETTLLMQTAMTCPGFKEGPKIDVEDTAYTLKLLLESKASIDIPKNHVMYNEFPNIVFLSCVRSQTFILPSLLKFGCSVESRNSKNFTPIIFSIFTNNPRAQEILLAANADLTAINRLNFTNACGLFQMEISRYLSSRTPNIQFDKKELLDPFAQERNEWHKEPLQGLRPFIKIMKPQFQAFLFFVACIQGSLECVKVLLEEGMDPNISLKVKDKKNNIVIKTRYGIDIALAYSLENIARLLALSGADLNVKIFGEPLLRFIKPKPSMFKLLLSLSLIQSSHSKEVAANTKPWEIKITQEIDKAALLSSQILMDLEPDISDDGDLIFSAKKFQECSESASLGKLNKKKFNKRTKLILPRSNFAALFRKIMELPADVFLTQTPQLSKAIKSIIWEHTKSFQNLLQCKTMSERNDLNSELISISSMVLRQREQIAAIQKLEAQCSQILQENNILNKEKREDGAGESIRLKRIEANLKKVKCIELMHAKILEIEQKIEAFNLQFQDKKLVIEQALSKGNLELAQKEFFAFRTPFVGDHSNHPANHSGALLQTVINDLASIKKEFTSLLEEYQELNQLDAKLNRAGNKLSVADLETKADNKETNDVLGLKAKRKQEKGLKKLARRKKRKEIIKNSQEKATNSMESPTDSTGALPKAVPKPLPKTQTSGTTALEPVLVKKGRANGGEVKDDCHQRPWIPPRSFFAESLQTPTLDSRAFISKRIDTLKEIAVIEAALSRPKPKSFNSKMTEECYLKFESYAIILYATQAMHSLNQKNQPIFPAEFANKFRNVSYHGQIFTKENCIKRNDEIRKLTLKICQTVKASCRQLTDLRTEEAVKKEIGMPLFDEIISSTLFSRTDKSSAVENICTQEMDRGLLELEELLHWKNTMENELLEAASFFIKARIGTHFAHYYDNFPQSKTRLHYISVCGQYREFGNCIRHNEVRPMGNQGSSSYNSTLQYQFRDSEETNIYTLMGLPEGEFEILEDIEPPALERTYSQEFPRLLQSARKS